MVEVPVAVVVVDAVPLGELEAPPVVVDEAGVALPDVAADVDDCPVEVDEPEEDGSDASALATPGDATTITPIPKAAASAPTRPMYRPQALTCEICELM